MRQKQEPNNLSRATDGGLRNKESNMSTKIIVSYDGTANEDDAIALGRAFARAGAEVSLAYVRHAQLADSSSETLEQGAAEELLQRGAALFGDANIARHVVTDRSTPAGLSALAEREGASAIVFCSDSHTARGHVAVGNSAQQLLEGGPVAVAIAPVGLGDSPEVNVQRIVAVGDADGGARSSAESLAAALGASVAPVANEEADLLIVDSRPEAEQGRVAVSASASHLVEIARCSVLVLPRGVALQFGRSTAAVGA